MTVDEVRQSMKRVRKAGYAVAFGEVTAGAVGIAAPVLDDRGTPIASVCVTIHRSAGGWRRNRPDRRRRQNGRK